MPDRRRVDQPGHRVAETWVIEQFTLLEIIPYAETCFALPYTVEGKK